MCFSDVYLNRAVCLCSQIGFLFRLPLFVQYVIDFKLSITSFMPTSSLHVFRFETSRTEGVGGSCGPILCMYIYRVE